MYDNWDSLINAASDSTKFDVAVNVFDHAENAASAIEALNLTSINTLDGLTPENWLWHIKNCKFVITDSYHYVCFSIIFKKHLVCIGNKLRGQERIKSLLDIFGFSGRMIDISELDRLRDHLFDDHMDYGKTFDDFLELKRMSHDFLFKSLMLRLSRRIRMLEMNWYVHFCEQSGTMNSRN